LQLSADLFAPEDRPQHARRILEKQFSIGAWVVWAILFIFASYYLWASYHFANKALKDLL